MAVVVMVVRNHPFDFVRRSLDGTMENEDVGRRKSVLYSVLGFRNNGEVVLEMEDDNDKGYAVEVYEPSSGHISGVGINDKYVGFFALLYMETLLLLHESNLIIR
ncbi:hypothetical protein Tco_1238024 [Tanacetum coccineum]